MDGATAENPGRNEVSQCFQVSRRSIGFTSVCIDEVTLSVKLLHMLLSGFGSAWSPAPPVVWCGLGFGFALSPSAPPWCGVVRGSGRPGCFETVVIIIILIGILIIMMFPSWVNCHRKRAREDRLLVTVACSKGSGVFGTGSS